MEGSSAWQAAALYREINRNQRANARDAERVKSMLAKGIEGLQAIASQLAQQFETAWEAKLAAQQATLGSLQRRCMDPHGIVQANKRIAVLEAQVAAAQEQAKAAAAEAAHWQAQYHSLKTATRKPNRQSSAAMGRPVGVRQPAAPASVPASSAPSPQTRRRAARVKQPAPAHPAAAKVARTTRVPHKLRCRGQASAPGKRASVPAAPPTLKRRSSRSSAHNQQPGKSAAPISRLHRNTSSALPCRSSARAAAASHPSPAAAVPVETLHSEGMLAVPSTQHQPTRTHIAPQGMTQPGVSASQLLAHSAADLHHLKAVYGELKRKTEAHSRTGGVGGEVTRIYAQRALSIDD